ncbi:carbohydrate binding domain-containing protein [Pseudomonas oryzicola]|uniref:Carbohydrate binding domain-containing protein n=1 Tax=Pseudomonas oryzicola TaxID=485876 RepID=A0ABS6Q683_9PSED|nr:carbohydrate binding domain-containing protein [Pseudomonas oryzicola]MBV4489611.1 carbohydrate binding domain-containing protein [Pseudomonas oryzicola]
MADTTYSDITDFSNGSMNGWEVSDFVGDKARIVQEASEGCVLDFPTLKEKADGIVLSKQYDGLASGKYQFVMRARSVSKSSPARISVVGADAKGGKFVIYETNLWQHNEDRWGNYHGSVVVEQAGSQFSLEIHNHNPELQGNDYRFSQFVLRSATDLTDFEAGEDQERLNGWVMRDDYKREFKDTPDEGKVLYLHTHSIEAGHEGVFLTKEYPLLEHGKEYEFSMRVWLDYGGNPPRLEVKADKDVVIEEVTLSKYKEWEDISGKFTVTDDVTKITIENYTATASGNDFFIAKLQLSPVN